MEEFNKNTLEISDDEKLNVTLADKTTKFFRDNMINLVLALVCVIYIFRGIANIEYSGKTIFEIIADTFITFIVGICIKTLWGKNGIIDGRKSDKFMRTAKLYGKQLDSITVNIEHLDTYCEYKNWLVLRRKQTTILRKAGLSYRLFINGEYDSNPDPEIQAVLKKTREVDVFQITSSMILNVIDSSEEETKILKLDIRSYEKTKLRNNILIGASTALLFGLCSLERGVFDVTGILWTTIQVAIFLVLGALEYLNCFEFITENFRGKMIVVIGYIDEFKNLIEKRPELFDYDIEHFKEEQAEKERMKMYGV